MIETIKQNPVPAALVGIGLGWMFFKHQSSSNDMQTAPSRYRDEWTGSGSYRTGRPFVQGPTRYDTSRHNGHGTANYGSDQGGASAPQIFDRVQDSAGQFADQAQDKAGQIADRVQGTAGQLMDQAQGMAGQAQETAGQIVDTVQERTQQVTGTLQEQFQSMLRERPLILGGLAVAAGLAVGLAIPATEKEDELLGETRDNLMGQAKQTAQDAQEKLQHVAQEAGRAAQDEAKAQHLTA